MGYTRKMVSPSNEAVETMYIKTQKKVKKASTANNPMGPLPYAMDDGDQYFDTVKKVSVTISPDLRERMKELKDYYGISNGSALIKSVITQHHHALFASGSASVAGD